MGGRVEGASRRAWQVDERHTASAAPSKKLVRPGRPWSACGAVPSDDGQTFSARGLAPASPSPEKPSCYADLPYEPTEAGSWGGLDRALQP